MTDLSPSRLAAVFVGGLVGSAARLGVSELLDEAMTATLAVNVLGAFLLGLFLVRHDVRARGWRSLHVWAIGALGAFTTFSAFGLEVVDLADRRHVAGAAVYAGGSVIAGLVAAFVGARTGGLIE